MVLGAKDIKIFSLHIRLELLSKSITIATRKNNIMLGLYLDYAWIMLGLFLEYTWIIFGSVGLCFIMLGLCLNHV